MEADSKTNKATSGTTVAVADVEPTKSLAPSPSPSDTPAVPTSECVQNQAEAQAQENTPSNGAIPDLAQQLINARGFAKGGVTEKGTKATKTQPRKPPVAGKRTGGRGEGGRSQREAATQAAGGAPAEQAPVGNAKTTETTTTKGKVKALPLEEGAPDESSANSQLDDGTQAVAQRLIKALEASRKAAPAPAESWQAAWEASCPMPEDHTRLILAGVATALAVVLCWGGVSCGTTLTNKALSFDRDTSATATVTPGTLRAAYLDDVRTGQEQLAGFWNPALEIATRTTDRSTRHSPGQTEPTGKHTRPTTVAQRASGTLAVPAPAPTIDPEFSQFHGSANRYRASTKRTGGTAPADNASTPILRPSGLGQTLHASLSNQLASNATGTMAKAVLTRKMTIGGHALPVGSELTGTISGGDDTRVFVDFTSLRLPNGQVLAILGKAADGKGRYGLPGRREISRRSVGSVGIASGNSMLVEAGQQVGGSIGGIIGRGIVAAASSAAEKASRADRDEYVVLVDRGAMFTVMVERLE